MTVIDISSIDLSRHVNYFGKPLSAALKILSSDNEDLYIDGRRIPYHARVREARGFFKVLRDVCDTGKFDIATATPMQIDQLVFADESYCMCHKWIEPKPRRLARRKCSRVQKRVFEVLSKLFSYSNFTNGIGWRIVKNDLRQIRLSDWNIRWDASEFQKEVVFKNNMRFCPYCNAETTFMLTDMDTKSRVSRSHLDHFYPKSVFPYLAVSLYNLVPACAHCNSSLKGEKIPWQKSKRSWLHPYAESFHNVSRFRYDHVDVATLYASPCNQLTVHLEFLPDVSGSLAEGFAKDLQLCCVYNQAYRKEINEIPYRLGVAMSQSPNLLSDILGCRIIDEQSKVTLNSSFDEDSIHNERLSKMIMDLVCHLIGSSATTCG